MPAGFVIEEANRSWSKLATRHWVVQGFAFAQVGKALSVVLRKGGVCWYTLFAHLLRAVSFVAHQERRVQEAKQL